MSIFYKYIICIAYMILNRSLYTLFRLLFGVKRIDLLRVLDPYPPEVVCRLCSS